VALATARPHGEILARHRFEIEPTQDAELVVGRALEAAESLIQGNRPRHRDPVRSGGQVSRNHVRLSAEDAFTQAEHGTGVRAEAARCG
jgi:hypothetical protein